MHRSTCLAVSQTSLVSKLLYLLKLPPTNVEWSASFFHISLSSEYGNEFQISPRELSRLRANIEASSVCHIHVQIEILKCKSWVTQRRSLKLIEQQSSLTFIINNPSAQISYEGNVVQGHNWIFFRKMLFKVIHIRVIWMKIDDDSSFHCMWKKWLMSAS